jgi:hypothetical protein
MNSSLVQSSIRFHLTATSPGSESAFKLQALPLFARMKKGGMIHIEVFDY